MLRLVAELACRGSLRVVDGGNHFNVLSLGRMIRRKTGRVKAVLNGIYVSRVFTCIQMEAALRILLPRRGPIVVIDMLHTFYDESVDGAQSEHLLRNCIRHLQRLSNSLPIIVSFSPPPQPAMRPALRKIMLEAADNAWHWETKLTARLQPTLWE